MIGRDLTELMSKFVKNKLIKSKFSLITEQIA